MNSVQRYCDWIGSKNQWKKKLFKALFRKYWLMWLFCLSCFLIYTQAMQKKQSIALELDQRIEQLKGQKELELAKQNDYLLQIASQDDPAWIELTLMKNLGVVPEGQVKMTFHR